MSKEALPRIMEQFDIQLSGKMDPTHNIKVKRKGGRIFLADVGGHQIETRREWGG